MNFRSIATRVTLPGIIAAAITALILLWIVPERQKQSLTESIQGELDGAAQAVAIRVVAALELERLNLLSDINDYLGQASGISVVAIYLGDRSSEAPFAVFPESHAERIVDDLSAGRLFFSEVDFTSEGASGVVLAGYEKRAFEARLRDINLPLYAVFGALLITQLLLFFTVSRRVIRPVQEAISTAVNIGATQDSANDKATDQSDSVHAKDELQQLTGVLDDLRDQLAARAEDNRQLLASLESKVEERTEDLERALAAKDEFIANVSHELRTPLHSIIASLDLVSMSTQADDPDIRGFVGIGIESSEALLDLINQLLEFQKAEVKGIELELGWFSLSDLIDRIDRIGQVMFRDTPVRFEVEKFGETRRSVLGDEAKLMQVLNNLLSNARKYTEQGEVKVMFDFEETEHGGRLDVTVKDTGIGMSESFLEKIHEPFSREQQFSTGYQTGTGLGIGIVNRILSALDSRLDIQSTLGEGSRFTFGLQFVQTREAAESPSSTSQAAEERDEQPDDLMLAGIESEKVAEETAGKASTELADEATVEQPEAAKGEPLSDRLVEEAVNKEESTADDSQAGLLRILYVEDTSLNRVVMKAMLAKMPVDLTMAESAKIGFDLVKRRVFDLVITDIQMPEHTGLELLEWIQRDLSLPVIAFTANADETAREVFLQAGFADVLTKPLNSKGLGAALEPYFHQIDQ